MDLKDYTDAELIAELKRRLRHKKGNEIKWKTWEAEVVKIENENAKYIQDIGYYLNSDEFAKQDKEWMSQYPFHFAYKIGVSKKRLPKIGDKVMLRYRDCDGITGTMSESKIIQVTKRK